MLRNLGMITAVAALALTQQACAGAQTSQTPAAAPTSPATAETASAEPATTSSQPAATTSTKAAAKPKDPILAGRRQIVIKPVESFESIVVLDGGKLTLTDGEAEHGLFVLTPHNGKFLIKTAKVTAGGEPDCVGVKNNGSQSLTAVATPCDTSKSGQLFDITATGKKDNGLPTYSIANQSAFLQITRSGLILEELGDAPLLTTYAFVDNGASKLPTLG
ncbi:MAG TPA: hypothetical protein VN408_35280 [Actinoplanes sp.]|nr:hypothetical protein [Actinoplanes sp.]